MHLDDTGIVHTPIKIPDPNYQWSVDQTEIGQVTSSGLFKSRVSEGPVEIKVEDQRMADNTAEGLIHVVYPYRIDVKVKDVTARETAKQSTESGELLALSIGLDLLGMG
jgi:hypothetical protein